MKRPPRWLRKVALACGVIGALLAPSPLDILGAASAGYLFATLIYADDRPANP